MGFCWHARPLVTLPRVFTVGYTLSPGSRPSLVARPPPLSCLSGLDALELLRPLLKVRQPGMPAVAVGAGCCSRYTFPCVTSLARAHEAGHKKSPGEKALLSLMSQHQRDSTGWCPPAISLGLSGLLPWNLKPEQGCLDQSQRFVLDQS